MPNILRWNGYRFFLFSNEDSEPPHIHIAKNGCNAKFWLNDCTLAYNDYFKYSEIGKLQAVVSKNRIMF